MDLSSTGLGVIVTFLVAGPPIPTMAGVGLALGAVALMLSLLLAVASFLPSTNLEKHLVGDRERPSTRDNLLYYGHLARYEPRALVEAIAEMYFDHEGETYAPSKLAIDLAAQIVTNARITVRKLALFRYSLLLFGFGVLVASAAHGTGGIPGLIQVEGQAAQSLEIMGPGCYAEFFRNILSAPFGIIT